MPSSDVSERMTDLERAYALVHSDPEHIEAALAAARREGAEAERAEWMSCARVDALMEGPALMGWNRSALERLWKRGLAHD